VAIPNGRRFPMRIKVAIPPGGFGINFKALASDKLQCGSSRSLACSLGGMTDKPERPDGQDSIDALLATADRCYRLAASITDRSTVERLLEMARECEELAAGIRRGADSTG
jgi:hypothetical protein